MTALSPIRLDIFEMSKNEKSAHLTPTEDVPVPTSPVKWNPTALRMEVLHSSSPAVDKSLMEFGKSIADGMNRMHAALKGDIEAISKDFSASFASLSTTVASLSTTVADLSTNVADLSTTVADLSTTVADLKQQQSVTSKRIEDSLNSIGALDEKITRQQSRMNQAGRALMDDG